MPHVFAIPSYLLERTPGAALHGKHCRSAHLVPMLVSNDAYTTKGGSSSRLITTELYLSSRPALQEHCLMGIKGTVRRATDGHIIHANVDTDVVVSEEPPFGSTRKPDELYQLIERFALGECCWCLVF